MSKFIETGEKFTSTFSGPGELPGKRSLILSKQEKDIYDNDSILQKRWLALTAFEKMRGQNHVKKYMKKGNNSRMGEIFKYEMWCKKTKIKDTNPKKSIEIN